tara:strand:- start:40 stop:537 length:498 start_codon:yes stop_codon:yes gene_type:complete
MGFFTDFVTNLKRNFTEPDKLAAEMGTQEVLDNVPEKDRRFDIVDGNWITKPYEDTRTQAQKDKDERADVRAKKAAEEAQKSLITETAEEVVTDTTPSKLETAKTNMLNMADTTQSTGVATVATEEAKKDKKKGYKGGTIVTSPQGLLAGSGDALRPKRSLLAAA